MHESFSTVAFQALPHDGINIFATQLHAHLTGRKLWISHKRGNKTLREVNRDDNYSTWIEKIVPEKPMTKFLPVCRACADSNQLMIVFYFRDQEELAAAYIG